LNRLNATDKAQFFANKMRDLGTASSTTLHKHLFVPGLDNLIQGQFWCTTCKKDVELPEDDPSAVFVLRKIEWQKDAVAYQDIDKGFKRRLFTGSFQPQLYDDWTFGTYQDGSSQEPCIVPASLPKRSPYTRVPLASGQAIVTAPPSFGSHNMQTPQKSMPQTKRGQFECPTCGLAFYSQNQLYRHPRATGHSLETPAEVPVSSPSYSSQVHSPTLSTYTAPDSPSALSSTIPIPVEDIYSTPTYSQAFPLPDISLFGPQPKEDIFFTMTSPTSNSSYNMPSLEAFQPTREEPKIVSQHSIPASNYGVPESETIDLPWEGVSVEDEMTKVFLLIGTLRRQAKISREESTVLKQLAIQQCSVLFAAVQVFEIERDQEDLMHTLRRLMDYRDQRETRERPS